MRSASPVPVLALICLLGSAAPAAAEEKEWPCLTCHDGQIDRAAYDASAHGTTACVECHLDVSLNPHSGKVQPRNPDVVVLARKLEHKSRQPVALAACARRECHGTVFAQVRESVHGAAVLGGKTDAARAAAYCLDCHGAPHAMPIVSRGGDRKLKNAYMCARCHADPKLIDHYRLNPDVWPTYQESMHGRKARLAGGGAASCSDCHGGHRIFRRDDPRSTVNPRNAAATCGACHTGAKPGFAQTFRHVPNSRKKFVIGWLAEHFFAYLTFGTIGFVAFHVILDVGAQLRKGLRRSRRKERD